MQVFFVYDLDSMNGLKTLPLFF